MKTYSKEKYTKEEDEEHKTYIHNFLFDLQWVVAHALVDSSTDGQEYSEFSNLLYSYAHLFGTAKENLCSRYDLEESEIFDSR